jgi:hypothetical protein
MHAEIPANGRQKKWLKKDSLVRYQFTPVFKIVST